MYWDKTQETMQSQTKHEAKYLLQDFRKVYSYNKLWQSSLDLSGKCNPSLVFGKAATSASLKMGFIG